MEFIQCLKVLLMNLFGRKWSPCPIPPPSSAFISLLKIHFAEGRAKAFTTCTFHLTAVSIFQGAILFMYFRPSSSYSLDEDKMKFLFYTLVTPLLNPLIFSLWNKDVKEVLVKLKAKLYFKIFVLGICAHNHTHIVTV